MIFISTKYNIINYNPLNTIEEVVTNTGMILRVFKEEQPLKREFSFDSNLIDKNITVVENKITSLLLKSFRKYEPRAALKSAKIILKDDVNNDFDIEIGIEVVNIE